MDLGKHVVDRLVLDRDGRRAGVVDDLLLNIPDLDEHGHSPPPQVVALISGPLALACQLPRPWLWLARQVYHLLGVADPHPEEIPWTDVSAIDVVVHLNVSRATVGTDALAQAVNRRYLSHIPGA